MVKGIMAHGSYETRPAALKTIKPTTAGPRPCYPDRADFYNRTTTFKNWPTGSSVKVSDLVNSGFSYLGIKDRVQCFHCGEIMEKWGVGENVDQEHLRNSPECAFILNKLGKILVRKPMYTPSEYNVTTTGPKLIQPCEPLTMPPMNYSQCLEPVASAAPKQVHPVAPRDIRARLDTPGSRKLLDMGFKKPLLAQVIGERLASVGDDFPSFMEYFIAVKNAEQIMSGGQVDTLKSYYDRQTARLSNPAGLVIRDETPAAPKPAVPATAPQDSAGAAANKDDSLRRKKECNVCMDAEADTVFMPCRHMCACGTCADKLETCPICRKTVEHCIKVYV